MVKWASVHPRGHALERRELVYDSNGSVSLEAMFQSGNLYAYCSSNPVMRRDVSGNFWDTFFDVVSLAMSVADVIKNPKSGAAWAGLTADIICTAVPGLTGGGTIVKAVTKADKVVDAAKGAGKVVKGADKAKDVASAGIRNADKPKQLHHFLSNKNSKFTSLFSDITKKYGLDLNGDWNKALMPHQGRHANGYHDYMLEQIKLIDSIAKGNKATFLSMYNALKQKIIKNPNMLYKDYWRK